MSTTGYMGKLPLRGDFVSGRLPGTFMNLWDDWSQQLVTVCETLKHEGNITPDLWYKLPIYRFYLSAKIAGDNAWIGVMLPSCDSVGRLFPFCLARNVEPAVSATTAFTQFESYLASAEALLQEIFSGNYQFETLSDRLNQLDNANPPATDSTIEPFTGQSLGTSVGIKVGAQVEPTQPGFWQTATHALLNTTFAGHSVWTTSPLSQSQPETLICEAMPTSEGCRGLFTGEYVQQHWATIDTAASTGNARHSNTLAMNNAVQTQPVLTPDEGDTKPIHKLPADQLPRATDFLELDGNDITDAPWDD